MSWTASLNRSKATTRAGLAFDTRYEVGRYAKTTAGFAPAAMDGIPSTQEECERSVSTSGRRPNTFRAVAGHRTRIRVNPINESGKTGMRAAYRQSFFVGLFHATRL
jgi:hypothetical protein